MRCFRHIFLAMFFVCFFAVMAGAHHQFALMIINAITYVVLTNQIKKDEKANY